MIKDYFLLALRGIIKRGLRSWLTMIGVFIGIAAIVSLIGLGEGLRETINSQFGFLGTDVLAVTASGGFGPPGSGVIDPLRDKELDAIRDIPGVDGVAARITQSVKLAFNRNSVYSYAISLPEGEDREVLEYILKLEVQKGRLLEESDTNSVFLGANYMKEDNEFGKAILPGTKVTIQDKEFKVIGIMERKGTFGIDGAIFMNEDELRDLADRDYDDDHDLIGVVVDSNADINEIKDDIEKKLRKIRDVDEGEENFAVETPQSIVESVNSILLGIQIFIYLIAGISLLVGGIGIMNTMYTTVVERTRDIGIMKSIGAKNSSIFTIFFIESGLMGSVGGIVGVIAGYSVATGVAFAGRLILGTDLISANVSPLLVIGALLFSFILGSFFGTLPAIQASKLNPVEAVRYAK